MGIKTILFIWDLIAKVPLKKFMKVQPWSLACNQHWYSSTWSQRQAEPSGWSYSYLLQGSGVPTTPTHSQPVPDRTTLGSSALSRQTRRATLYW